MKDLSLPVIKDVVLVGAGHAHVAVLRMFGMKPIPGVRFTLITREVHTPYSGMLPGLVAGHYAFDDAHIDTGPLARFAGARLYQDEAIDLDVDGRRVICRHRPPVPYDLLSLDIGSTPNTGDIPGAAEHAIPVKPIDGFLGRFEALKARVLARDGRHAPRPGRGRGGRRRTPALGRAAAAPRRSRRPGSTPMRCRSCWSRARPTSCRASRRRVRAAFRTILAARSIAAITGAAVTRVEAGRLVFDERAPIEADEILWTTQAAPARWLAATGLAARRARLPPRRRDAARARPRRHLRRRRHHRV